jgi:peptidoglycan hydrolase-like protein with peptidoglycan-binding domain
MSVSNNNLARGDSGKEVRELQLRLAGFRGTDWDGQFGPGTELQVITFQKDYMGMESPDGIAGANTFKALKRFIRDYPIRFSKLKCPCRTCEGFG